MRISVLHPGVMGAYVGYLLSANHDVMWLGDGRSSDTRERATSAGFIEVANLTDLVNGSDVVFSICPPHAAIEVARSVAEICSHGFLYVDANTISPRTIREISDLFDPNVVADAAITGAPEGDNLTVWVSGKRNSEVCDLFAGTRITCRIVGERIGQSSAFKICAGLRSKVIPAVWATLIEAGVAAGPEVEFALRAHLGEIGFDLSREAARVEERAPKAGRWVGEMEESAKAMSDLGFPVGFSEAASITYARIASRSS